MPFFAVSFVLALILLLVYKKTRRMRLFVIWIIVPYVIFFFIPASFYYYTLPYLTAVAVLTILGFWAIKSKFLRITCLVLLLILGAGQFIIFSFFFPSKACKVSHKEFYTPQMNDSPAAKMVDRIIEESRAKSITIGVWFIEGCEAQQKKISFGDDGILLSIPMLQYAFDLKGISRDIFDVRARERGGDGALPNFIILPFLLEKADFSAIQKNHYGLIDEFDLADQSKIYLYKFFDPSVEQANVNIHRYEADGGVYLSNFGAQISSPLIHLELKNNVWKIFWKGREITKRLSVYTSFRSSGHWIDSRQYVWFTRKVSDKHIRGIAFEPSVPLCQIWDFIIAGQRIYWNVKGIVPVSVNLEREQSNVMLSSEYAYWFDASSSGEFPKKFNQDFGGDWQVLKEIRPGAEYIGARSEDISLPKVTFHSLDPQKGLKGYIINSDDMFQGRVLQYVMKHQDNFFRWFSSYEYFSGYIDFEDAGQQIRR
jgi:hypothetical protein